MSIFHSMITHVFNNINFWITGFTNVFLLFKSKNLFDLKSISRNYCHKIDISFFLFTHWCYYFTRFIQLFICINIYPPDVCNKWNLKLWKKLFLSLSGICNKNSNLEDKMKYPPVHLLQKSNPWNIKISRNFSWIYAKNINKKGVNCCPWIKDVVFIHCS